MGEYKFEKLSFWQLLENRSVQVPIIQRDYAQGRANKQKVRNNFLDALKNAFSKNPIELDFVYGSEKNNILHPLDGQQRLTTLFLLHWYIANKEGESKKAKERLLKFSYETRTSSREFCNELVNKSIDVGNLIPINKKLDISVQNQLSETIKNASWFVMSWKNDPTISAMLTMLDAIHGKFKETLGLWPNLIESEKDKRLITFLYIKLENFGLSDDLYIKMNARGKHLTDFENFKAKFEQYIKQVIYKTDENGKEVLENGQKVMIKDNWEKELEIIDEDSETEKEEKLKKYFYYKIDTVWADLFWKYRSDDYKIDESILKFLANAAILFYAQNLEIYDDKYEKENVRNELELKRKNKNITDDSVKRERIERRIAKLFNDYSTIQEEDFSTKEAFQYLKECLDIYCKDNNDKLNAELLLWEYKSKDSSLFKDLIKVDNSSTYKQRVLFYAQSNYVKNVGSKITVETFSDWLRVVRNIIENATIDSSATFMGAINLIKELSNGCNDVYDFLSKNSIQSKFAEDQVKEEIEKAKIIVAQPQSKQVIHNTEDTSFCKGRIDFALYCADYDIEKNHDLNVFIIVNLEKILNVIESNFRELDSKLSNDFKRTFLTIRSNNYYEVWGTWSHSFNSHKRWLLEFVRDLKSFSKSKDWKREYLKELFSQLEEKGSYSKIIDDYEIPEGIPNWKQRLIKEKDLIKNASFILIPNDNSFCKLAWQQRPSREDQVTKIS